MRFLKLLSYIFILYIFSVNNLFAEEDVDNNVLSNSSQPSVNSPNNSEVLQPETPQEDGALKEEQSPSNQQDDNTSGDAEQSDTNGDSQDSIQNSNTSIDSNESESQQDYEVQETTDDKNFDFEIIDDDLKIKNNSKEDKNIPENSNLNVVLLLDSSGSMEITDPMRLRDEGVRLFLQFLKDGDKISIVKFSDKTKVLMKNAYFNKDGLDTLSKGIAQIKNTGLYTDLYNGINKALSLFYDTEGDKEEYQNIIILFSDGKMEPDEKIISKEDALKKLSEEVIPELKAKNIKLYTLAFSDEADKELLKSLADSTDALSWFTPDADKIHESFSKLFLAAQKPQILPISEKGLRIDGQIDEATFYLNVQDNKDIVIISPDGKKITKEKHEDNVKWFSGSKFEIITVTAPESGIWNFFGSISKDDFATVLTKLKLVTFWPYSVNANDENILEARVFDGKKPLVLPEVSKLATVAYRITPTDRVSAPIAEGILNDDGKDRDKEALDGVFSANLKISTPGEYELWVVIKTPTFERHQKIPFIVKPRLISLEEPFIQGDKSAIFTVTLNEDALLLRNLNVNLTAKILNKTFDIPLKFDKSNPGKLFSTSKYLPQDGDYAIFASLSGIDQKGSPVTSTSQSISFKKVSEEDVSKKVIHVDIKDDIDEGDKKPKEVEVPKGESYLFHHLVVLLSNCFILILAVIFLKKGLKNSKNFDLSNYKVSEDIFKKIQNLDEKSKVQEVDTSSFVFMDDEEDESNNSSDGNQSEGINFEEVTSISNVKVDDEDSKASADNTENNGQNNTNTENANTSGSSEGSNNTVTNEQDKSNNGENGGENNNKK